MTVTVRRVDIRVFSNPVTYTHMHTRINMHTHAHTHTCTHIHAHTCMYTHAHTHAHTCTHTHMYRNRSFDIVSTAFDSCLPSIVDNHKA